MKNHWLFGIIGLSLLFLVSSVLFNVFEIDILPSQFFGALIGVVITAIITVFLLQGQSEQEVQRDKDVKIFEQKILVYSEFTEKMWGMLDNDDVTEDELLELRAICFKKLVFYLNGEQVDQICEQIKSIDPANEDTVLEAAGKITHILHDSLDTVEKLDPKSLKKLFNSFEKS